MLSERTAVSLSLLNAPNVYLGSKSGCIFELTSPSIAQKVFQAPKFHLIKHLRKTTHFNEEFSEMDQSSLR